MINILKKVFPPIPAIYLFSVCSWFSKQVIGTPSAKVSTRNDQLVSLVKGRGNFIFLSYLNIYRKISRFYFYLLKSIWSMRVFFIDTYETGMLKDFEKRERVLLKKNIRLMSVSMYLSTPGCLTLTATFCPLYLALYT